MKCSGFVFLPLIPDIISLRFCGETTSAMRDSFLRMLAILKRFYDMRFHTLGYRFHYGHNNGITELLVGLSVRDRNNHFIALRFIKAHKACAFTRRQTARVFTFLLDLNFRAVLVV